MSKDYRCEQCGALLLPGASKRKRFCSTRCRNLWWSAHPEQMNRQARYKAICKYCGKEFEAYGNKNRTFCSTDCYTKARFGTKEERDERATAKQRELLQRTELPDHCLACPYFLQAQDHSKV